MDHESWAFCEAVKPGQVRAIWWEICCPGLSLTVRHIYTIYPGCSVIGNRCLHAAVERWLQITAALQCGSCSNNSHLLQRFVNLDVRHQLELQEYHHRVKMETERDSDYLRRSGERPWAHVHMWPLVYSLLIIKPQLVGFMSGSKWCVATLVMMNVMWGKVWLGLGFIYLSVGGSHRLPGAEYSRTSPITHHRAQGGWRDSGFGGNYNFKYLQKLNRSASEETINRSKFWPLHDNIGLLKSNVSLDNPGLVY